MKENVIFTVETDVNEIECYLTNAEVTVAPTAEGKLTVEYPLAKNVSVGNGDGELIISQGKRGPFNRSLQQIKIYVPTHTVPSFKINGKVCRLSVTGGIYGEISVTADDGSVSLSDCAFENAEIAGGEVQVSISGATVKNNLFLQIDKGDVLAENSFAKRCECRIKKGNVGLANVTCKDCSFNSQKGNITATLSGSESGYNTTLVTGEGTSSRDSVKNSGAESNFKAYAQKGNITLDFLEEEKENV